VCVGGGRRIYQCVAVFHARGSYKKGTRVAHLSQESGFQRTIHSLCLLTFYVLMKHQLKFRNTAAVAIYDADNTRIARQQVWARSGLAQCQAAETFHIVT